MHKFLDDISREGIDDGYKLPPGFRATNPIEKRLLQRETMGVAGAGIQHVGTLQAGNQQVGQQQAGNQALAHQKVNIVMHLLILM